MTEPTTTDSDIDLASRLEQDLTNLERWLTLPGVRPTKDQMRRLIERLRAAEAALDAWRQIHMDVVATLQVDVSALTTERDELKESLRTTRLEQAAKAFQVDDLETKVQSLTAQLAAIESYRESP